MKFKFGTHAPRQSPDMIPEKNSRKRGVARITCPLIFWALNADRLDSSKVAKGSNIKFGTHAPSEVPT